MLHCKPDSNEITIADLDDLFNEICNKSGESNNRSAKVQEVIHQEARVCLGESGGLKLENKIVLAIATRCLAEQYIIDKIQDDEFVRSIETNQTQALIRKLKDRFPNRSEVIKVLDRVSLMTPENIHVNSFMYEPIVDMSDEHLKKLYRDVSNLV